MTDFFLPFKQKKEEIFLALDIGTETVKALIFKKSDKKIIILGSSLQYFDRFGVFDSRDFEMDVLKKAISKAIEEVQSQAKIKTNSTLISLPAKIFKGRVFFHSFERLQPAHRVLPSRAWAPGPEEIIKEREEEIICQRILKETKKKIFQIYTSETGILPEHIQFINFKILETKIDGYEVPYLQGFTGKKLDFRILATFLPKYYFKNIKKITQELNLKFFQIINLAENLPDALAIKKISAIFLDVGGGVTQIFLTKEGKLEKVDEFEMGGKNFLESLSQTFGINLERARNLAQNYSQRLLSEGVRKQIKKIFTSDSQRWFKNLKSRLKGKNLLPSNIFLFGGGSLIPEIEEILEEGNLENLLFLANPEVKFIYPKDLRDIEDKTKRLNSPQFTSSLLLIPLVLNS